MSVLFADDAETGRVNARSAAGSRVDHFPPAPARLVPAKGSACSNPLGRRGGGFL